MYRSRLGELTLDLPEREQDIVGAPLRNLPPLVTTKKIRFGTVGMGMDLPRLVWSAECQVFSSQDTDMTSALQHRPRKQEVRRWDQLPKSFLRKNPVDVLLVDEGDDSGPHNTTIEMIEHTPPLLRPKVMVASGPSNRILGLPSHGWRKQRRKRLEKLGYVSLEWFMSAEQQGSALQQERLVEVFLASGGNVRGLPDAPLAQCLPPRSMKNMLLPPGKIPRQSMARSRPAMVKRGDVGTSEDGLQMIGHLQQEPVYSSEGCMPDQLRAWISDSDTGTHRLQGEELAKGKGLPTEWRTKATPLLDKPIQGATCLHIWASVCDTLSSWLKSTTLPVASVPLLPTPNHTPQDVGQEPAQAYAPPNPKDMPSAQWDYELPDLTEGGQWYQDRLVRLREVIQGRPDEEQLWLEGLEALTIHRENYTDAGPKYLQVLWWEFPELHREAVRVGSSMRFLVDPGEELVPNPPLTPEQLEVVCKFVDELKDLGVVRPATQPLRRVCPLFVVQKPGQPGQWRCIADMKRGGQNGHCGLEPIYLPSSRDLLPSLYENGWSAIADASKYFHNFTTLPEERDLIGIIHPGTGEHLWYVGLPMGSVNSPSISCRFGEGLLDMLRSEHEIFRAVTYRDNTWRQALATNQYDPRLGHGYVGIRAGGGPVAILAAFVDDFFIHAANAQDCCTALTAFMDLMVRVGMICQKVKTSPPKQVQKYCGFLYDTRGTPMLHIPPNKVSRCLASVDFLLARPRNERLSRLSLAIITGVLQSVVEATPQHEGQSHLRALYDDLHLLEEGVPTQGAAKYYTQAHLSPLSMHALTWWKAHLQHAPGSATYRATCGKGITIQWGDGSGTGTGGTTEFYEVSEAEVQASPHMELWMGVWGAKSKDHTSNWKEARTILEALRRERGSDRLRGRMVFAMTDNLVSYYVINQGSSRSPHLHQLVMEIKAICQELGCQLEVVHVPGTIMIDQGTDGLSRGLWLAPERRVAGINQRLFDSVPYTPALGRWACQELGLPAQVPYHCSYEHPESLGVIYDRVTVWTPPPECGRQVIAHYLRLWVQAPEASHGIFLIPRILQRQWGRVARYVVEKGVYLPGALPDSCRYTSHLPFVLLHIPPHTLSLRRDRMELPPRAQPKGWHKSQAETVRGLS